MGLFLEAAVVWHDINFGIAKCYLFDFICPICKKSAKIKNKLD